MSTINMKGFGEAIHDHQGVYRTVMSGNMEESEMNQSVLKDVQVGGSAEDNLILDLGGSNGEYIFANYCSKKSQASVAMGRSHAVYLDCSLENLSAAELLLFYPYANAAESQNLICSPEGLESEERRQNLFWQAKIRARNAEESVRGISAELLYHMICYSLKKKSTGFRNFLYVSVPDSVSDYQWYCKSVTAKFLSAIPVGLRRQFRFATNAAAEKEKNYHILFCRASLIAGTDREAKCVQLDSDKIPAFLREHGLEEKLAALIRRCVDSAYKTGGNVVTACFDTMERKVGDVRTLQERDYRDYFEIMDLAQQELTENVLKGYSEKLGQGLKERQLQILHSQICISIPDGKTLEEVLRGDPKIKTAVPAKKLFEALLPYRELIQYLRSQGIEFSKAFYQECFGRVEDDYWTKKCQDQEGKDTQALLSFEKEWGGLLAETYSDWTDYFQESFIEESKKASEREQERLRTQYKKELLQTWQNEVAENFTAQQIEKSCSNVQSHYPEEMEAFGKTCCGMLLRAEGAQQEKEVLIKKVVDVLMKYQDDLQIPEKLHPYYMKESERNILENPEREFVKSQIKKVGSVCGEEKKELFVRNLATKFERQLTESEKTALQKKSYTEISKLYADLRGYGPKVSSSQEMKLFERIADEYISAELIQELRRALEQRGKEKDAKADLQKTYFQKAEKYVYSVREGMRCKEQMEGVVRDWENRKAKQERLEKILEETVTFETYFYSRKHESDLLDDESISNLRRNICEANLGGKKRNYERYNLSAFLAAAGCMEGYALEKLLFEEATLGCARQGMRSIDHGVNTLRFYMEEFVKFSEMDEIPILLKKQDTVSQILQQLECHHRLHSFSKEVTFVWAENHKKAHRMSVAYHTAEDVLRMLLKIKARIPKTEENDVQSRISGSERGFWEFLYDCGMLTRGDCERMLESVKGSEDMEALCEKFIKKKKGKKILRKAFQVTEFVIILLLAAGIFFAGYTLANRQAAKEQPQSTESSDNIPEAEPPDKEQFQGVRPNADIIEEKLQADFVTK